MTPAQALASWVPAPPPADTFANRLRLMRLAMNDAGAQETAARCGVPYPTWRKWEAGALPRDMAQVVRKIHDATGVDMGWLMWGSASTGPGTPAEQGNALMGWKDRTSNVTYLPDRTEPDLAAVGLFDPKVA